MCSVGIAIMFWVETNVSTFTIRSVYGITEIIEKKKQLEHDHYGRGKILNL